MRPSNLGEFFAYISESTLTFLVSLQKTDWPLFLPLPVDDLATLFIFRLFVTELGPSTIFVPLDFADSLTLGAQLFSFLYF